MKDLFVLTADAEMQAVFRTVLNRPEALGIRPITFDVDRHLNRDSGVFREGPEFIRKTISKAEYSRFIIALDHDGSGCRKRPDECAGIIQDRLDSCTFTNRSMVVVISPELEEWLWHDPRAIDDDPQLTAVSDPKKRLHHVFLKRHQRQPRVLDFENIARRADLTAWTASLTFRAMQTTLQNWFSRT
jgi:hypothetical protein